MDDPVRNAEKFEIHTPPDNSGGKTDLVPEAGKRGRFRSMRTQIMKRRMEREEKPVVERREVAVQTNVTLPEKMIGIWSCRCPEADTIVDAPPIEAAPVNSESVPVPVTPPMAASPLGFDLASRVSQHEDEADTHEESVQEDRSTAPQDETNWGNKADIDMMEQLHRREAL